MNKAKYVASLIVSVSVAIVVAGAGASVWFFRHERPAVRAQVFVLPPASSAPFPEAAISHPGAGHYLGVVERNTPSSYRPVTNFTSVAGRKPNITVYYSQWGTSFRARFATAAAQTGAVVLVQMQPWHASLAGIAAGRWDGYLRRFAGQVRHYGGQVILSFAPEANGGWYPWGRGQASAANWVAAWRHVVTVFRDSGAINVTWLWDVSGRNRATGHIRSWWPGPGYVDWIGIDGYYFTRGDTFRTVIGSTVQTVRKFTQKPILVSEVGIGPRAGQARKLPGLFAGIRRDRLLGLIWFDVAQNQGLYHQNWRLTGPGAVAAFRTGVRSLH